MIGLHLHHYDVALCQYALGNIRSHMDKPAFAAYVIDQLDASMMAYLHALAGETDPKPLLLADQELSDLVLTFESGPLEFDRPWEPYEPLHRKSIDCVNEIRDALTKEHAEEWARASAQFTKTLERDRTRLSDGLQAVHDWIREARRLLRAMGALALLPFPEGSFPTPSCPEPPPLPSAPSAPTGRQSELNANGITAAIAETQTLQREVRDLLLNQRTVKDYYTTADLSVLLGKSEFTVREWCRNGRVHGQKQGSGRGKHQAWVISHDELQRFQRDGLLPVMASK